MTKRFILKYSWFIFGIVFFMNASAQDSTQVAWEKANAFYTTEEYQKAISAYEQILSSGRESAKLYFNLGNAYYKTGDVNNAILNYERAKLLAPQDEDIDFNLKLANQFVVTEIEALPQPFFVRWRERIINMHPADTWAGISIAAFVLFLGLLGLFIFSRSSSLKRLSFWFGILAIAVSGFTFSFAARQKEKINQRKDAIVFCPRVTVKSAPAQNSTDLFLLYEGVKVEISDSVDTWKEIKLSDGNVGWLPDSCIVRI
ncbi:Tetratricopeptide repeat-containing protein [Mariniphaga anaerophila]|uniref:Tetratricopeptide repeat-containing protein n=1 Tax=Mariniphaga anaerophila TaxID=1484053 RepID=A0A1M5G904_9BACT|nr:tetratricopeptide repeat protein [Mariniphaga anaerophila]SHG00196.1 Tetratricopeptide repeat-containing protein [Mariniphaga anaerophila]